MIKILQPMDSTVLYSTGKRKNAVAKVWMKAGSGKITVNGRDCSSYFCREILVSMAKSPFLASKMDGKFDVVATINGGGKTGQSGAITNAISKILVMVDVNNRALLRKANLLTRDSRVVERKKYGLKKARKGQTYRKR